MGNFIRLLLIVFVSILGCKSQPVQKKSAKDNIVLINAGLTQRIGIAKELAVLNKFNPKVVAMDMVFAESGIPFQDSSIVVELNKIKRLVMAGNIEGFTGNDTTYSTVIGSRVEFFTNAKIGYTNAKVDDDGFLRSVTLFESVSDSFVYHFAIQTALEFDSSSTVKFLKGKPRVVDVEYTGNQDAFTVFSHDDLLKGNVKASDINGKIVLIGYLGPYDGYRGKLENIDKFYTPLNDRTKPHTPDMYGVVFIANIIAQILKE